MIRLHRNRLQTSRCDRKARTKQTRSRVSLKEWRFEENGEMERALEAYRKVLNVDPGQSELASRVAGLLIQQDDFPAGNRRAEGRNQGKPE